MCITLSNSISLTGENVKYLEINFDLHLIKPIEHEISYSIGIIYKLKPFLSKSALLKLYYAIIHPYLLYALPAWRYTYPAEMSKLYILQNKAINLIYGD